MTSCSLSRLRSIIFINKSSSWTWAKTSTRRNSQILKMARKERVSELICMNSCYLRYANLAVNSLLMRPLQESSLRPRVKTLPLQLPLLLNPPCPRKRSKHCQNSKKVDFRKFKGSLIHSKLWKTLKLLWIMTRTTSYRVHCFQSLTLLQRITQLTSDLSKEKTIMSLRLITKTPCQSQEWGPMAAVSNK